MAPTRNEARGCPGAGSAEKREELVCRPVTEAEGLDELLAGSLPAFGGSDLRQLWLILDRAIASGVPMALSVSGPVTLSGQHYTWLNPLLDTGWFLLVSTTDAVCYHDGHRALDAAGERPFFRVDRNGDDGGLRDEGTIRVTDVGFPEATLLEQDRFLRAVLAQEEFQDRMSGTRFRNLLGRRFAAQEARNGAREGLLALCHRKAIPIFVGAPADGSVFLNSVALAARAARGGPDHRLELDLHREVLESCAIHLWGVEESETGALGTLILGGGVPKNFNLQPEPALSQVLGIEVPGYLFDVQITTAPVSDGSLSSCPPAEAVTWGKVDKDAYRSTCISLQADYTTVMPFVARALLEKRARFERWEQRMGRDELLAKHPDARGYLRPREGYRMMERLEALTDRLLERAAGATATMPFDYPLAPLR